MKGRKEKFIKEKEWKVGGFGMWDVVINFFFSLEIKMEK